MTDFNRNVYCLLGLPFDAVGMESVIQRVRDAAKYRTGYFFSTPNLNFLIGCRRDAAFRDSVINSQLSIVDGMPLIWIARILGIAINERVAGSAMFDKLGEHAGEPLSVFFFGGQEGVAAAAAAKLASDWKGLRCAGFHCPGFGSVAEMSDEETIQKINASGADFLVVALGARKGQAWIEHNRARISVPVISYLGAVVNFVAGTVNRAPVWMQRSGLEWLWRIKEEPILWHRYFTDGKEFFGLLVTRVLPYAWYLRRNQPSTADLAAATFDFTQQGQECVLSFTGTWAVQNMERLRPCFARAAAMGQNIQLNMAQVGYVDSAFIGLVMLLYKSQHRHGRKLRIEHLQTQIQSVFRWNCADFLLE